MGSEVVIVSVHLPCATGLLRSTLPSGLGHTASGAPAGWKSSRKLSVLTSSLPVLQFTQSVSCRSSSASPPPTLAGIDTLTPLKIRDIIGPPAASHWAALGDWGGRW